MIVSTVFAIKNNGKYYNFITKTWDISVNRDVLNYVTLVKDEATDVILNNKGAELIWLSTYIEGKENNNV